MSVLHVSLGVFLPKVIVGFVFKLVASKEHHVEDQEDHEGDWSESPLFPKVVSIFGVLTHDGDEDSQNNQPNESTVSVNKQCHF